jgi:hypothetical protein
MKKKRSYNIVVAQNAKKAWNDTSGMNKSLRDLLSKYSDNLASIHRKESTQPYKNGKPRFSDLKRREI